MARAGLRTTVVVWLRVLLPLAALAVLSTLFLLSRHPRSHTPPSGALAEAEERAREPQITAPSWTGVTRDGARLTLAAQSAALDPDGRIETARGVYLHWQAADGVTATVAAPTGQLTGDMITLDGGVSAALSSGWDLTAPRIDAATDRSWLVASGGVDASAPFGTVSSQTAILRPARPDDGVGEVLDFTGDVRLVYVP